MATRFVGLMHLLSQPAWEGFQAGMKSRMQTGSKAPAIANTNQLNNPGLYIYLLHFRLYILVVH